MCCLCIGGRRGGEVHHPVARGGGGVGVKGGYGHGLEVMVGAVAEGFGGHFRMSGGLVRWWWSMVYQVCCVWVYVYESVYGR